MASNEEAAHRRGVIGSAKDFWLYSSRTGFDLTHPSKPSSSPLKDGITLETNTSPITVDPAKTALVIIDMQNFFLSPAFGRSRGAGHAACDQLVEHAVPAARKAGIRIVWLNWGLDRIEVEEMPPAIKRAFGFEVFLENEQDGFGVDKHGNPRHQGGHQVLENGKDGRIYKGLGCDCGTIKDPETGREVNAGKLLMRDQWNSGLYPPLDRLYEEGARLDHRPDVWIHKNRMSGMWGATGACEAFLENEGIKTLFFAGVNTDQCVGGTYQDSFSKGYDCILLGDGCGTTSPDYAQQCMEFNAAKTWGFSASCKQLADGVASSCKSN